MSDDIPDHYDDESAFTGPEMDRYEKLVNKILYIEELYTEQLGEDWMEIRDHELFQQLPAVVNRFAVARKVISEGGLAYMDSFTNYEDFVDNIGLNDDKNRQKDLRGRNSTRLVYQNLTQHLTRFYPEFAPIEYVEPYTSYMVTTAEIYCHVWHIPLQTLQTEEVTARQRENAAKIKEEHNILFKSDQGRDPAAVKKAKVARQIQTDIKRQFLEEKYNSSGYYCLWQMPELTGIEYDALNANNYTRYIQLLLKMNIKVADYFIGEVDTDDNYSGLSPTLFHMHFIDMINWYQSLEKEVKDRGKLNPQTGEIEITPLPTEPGSVEVDGVEFINVSQFLKSCDYTGQQLKTAKKRIARIESELVHRSPSIYAKNRQILYATTEFLEEYVQKDKDNQES